MNPGTTISEKMSMEEQLKQHGGGGQFADMFSPHNPIDAFQVSFYDVFELFLSKKINNIFIESNDSMQLKNIFILYFRV